MIQKKTELGNIELSNDVIATICGGAATRVFYSWNGAEFNFCSFFHDFFVKFCEF